MIKYNLRLFISAFSLRIISFFFQATLPLILIDFDIASARSYWYFILVLWIFGLLGALYSKFLEKKGVIFASFLIMAIMALLLSSNIKILLLISVYIIFMMVSAFSAGSGASSYTDEHKGVSIYSAGLAFGLTAAILAQLLFFNLKNLIALSLIVLLLVLLTAIFYPYKGHREDNGWNVQEIKRLLSSKALINNIIGAVSGSMAWPFAVTFLGIYAYKFLDFSLTMVSIAFLISVVTSAIVRLILYMLHEPPGSIVQKISVMLYGFSILIGVVFRQPAIFLISMFTLGVAHGIYSPLILYGFLKNSSDRLIGYLVYNASSGASEIISSVLGGILISQLNYPVGISTFAIFFILLNIAVFSFGRSKGRVF